MNKEIIILGDIEMGGGTLTDDFISDKALCGLIDSLTKKKHPVDLILNGDTFDFLKCPYIINNVSAYPRHITSEISLAKLRLIHNAHSVVFESLKNFVAKNKNQLYLIIGNHDADLVYPEVQSEIRKILQSSSNIFFPFSYSRHGVHAEHGHQYDFLNRVDEDHLFLRYKGQRILNIPWVALGIISRFMTIKEEYPLMERIVPKPAIFSHRKTVVKIIHRQAINYFLKSSLYYPIRYYDDPTYTFPKELFREFYRRFKKVHWEVDDIVETFKKKRKKHLRNNSVYVLGHVHKRYLEELGDVTIIHPDTWRDEYHMDIKTRMLTPKAKRYVQVTLDERGIKGCQIVEVPLKRSALHFDDVIRDEKKYIALAEREEGLQVID